MHRLLALFILFALILPPVSAQADRSAAQALGIKGPISQSQAEAIAARHLSGTVRSTAREMEDGVEVYEVKVASEGHVREATIRISDGAVLEVEAVAENEETSEAIESTEEDESVREEEENEFAELEEDDEMDEDGDDEFEITYSVAFNPTTFVAPVTNPYFPLVPGTTRRYVGRIDGGTETDIVDVLHETRDVAGVSAIVVRDRGYEDGELVEDTYDWYAQDAEGNVWYLGEDSREIEDGEVVGTHGSWEAGVDGAQAGIIMPARPSIGQGYWQERRPGVAEDRARVIRIGEEVTIPLGSYSNCVTMEESTPLEQGVREQKTYCPGIGEVVAIENLSSGTGFVLGEVTTQ